MLQIATEQSLPVHYYTDRHPFLAVGKSMAIECPICLAPAGQRCGPADNHEERGRMARWDVMGF
jgi:hypothetical protein